MRVSVCLLCKAEAQIYDLTIGKLELQKRFRVWKVCKSYNDLQNYSNSTKAVQKSQPRLNKLKWYQQKRPILFYIYRINARVRGDRGGQK